MGQRRRTCIAGGARPRAAAASCPTRARRHELWLLWGVAHCIHAPAGPRPRRSGLVPVILDELGIRVILGSCCVCVVRAWCGALMAWTVHAWAGQRTVTAHLLVLGGATLAHGESCRFRTCTERRALLVRALLGMAIGSSGGRHNEGHRRPPPHGGVSDEVGWCRSTETPERGRLSPL